MEPILWPHQLTLAPNCGVFAASPPALKEEGQTSSTAPQLCSHFALFLQNLSSFHTQI